ncbi:hypothetical protein T484DRAFT_2178481 [Baffinella frigidus]|nr:hypothetical protein T484DRAFT_2178481 [Cryptophyta sp. CCMP2293]
MAKSRRLSYTGLCPQTCEPRSVRWRASSGVIRPPLNPQTLSGPQKGPPRWVRPRSVRSDLGGSRPEAGPTRPEAGPSDPRRAYPTPLRPEAGPSVPRRAHPRPLLNQAGPRTVQECQSPPGT